MSDHLVTEDNRWAGSIPADAIADQPLTPQPHVGPQEAGLPARRPRRFPPLAGILAALLVALSTVLTVAAPAQAASYRHLKSVRYGICAYNRGDPLEDFRNQTCGSKPTADSNWSVTNVGYYNNHPLWVLHKQAGSCLGVLNDQGEKDPYLYMTCSATGSRNVWEVFTTSSGRYVLKSFGSYMSWGVHRCLTFNGVYGYRPQLGGCSLTSSTDMIYR